MNVDLNAVDLQIVQNRMPQIDRKLIIVPAKREVSQHLKVRQMRAVTYQIEVIRPDTRLQRTMSATIGLVKSGSDLLHTAANKQRRIIIVGHDRAINDQGKAELFKSAANYVQRAKRRVISLSSRKVENLLWENTTILDLRQSGPRQVRLGRSFRDDF